MFSVFLHILKFPHFWYETILLCLLVDKSAEQGLTNITGILQWSINFLISSQQNARNFMDQ